MRIATGGIHIECSTYNPVLTRTEDFRVLRGDALLGAPYFSFLSDYPAEFLPLLHARAVPGGPIAQETYVALRDEFLERLKAVLPVEGVYLAMHGAMFVEGMEDAEGDWICRTRELVGDDCFISASYDLHGNLSQRILDALDMYSTYRTAPHIDVEATMRRSVSMLVKSLETGIRPSIVWCRIPVLLPGERTSTEDEPARGLYGSLPAIDAKPGIWDASLMVGYVWADEPRATAATVMTGTDQELLTQEAATLAQAYWDARDRFAFGTTTGSIEGCVERAIAGPSAPAIIADSGDNPTGGGVGDRADVLRELIRQKAEDCIVAAITDRPATEAAFAAGVGATLALNIGATLDTEGSTPVAVTATVLNLVEGDALPEREAVLKIDGITLVVSARRRPYHNLSDFSRLGLEPRDRRILVVKSGYLSPELAPIAAPSLMALSAGVVDQDVEHLVRTRTPMPVYPCQKDFDWQPKVLTTRQRANRS